MIQMTAGQTAAARAELDRVWSLAAAAVATTDTAAMIAALRSVSMASMNAVQVIRDIEAEIRTGATQKEPA